MTPFDRYDFVCDFLRVFLSDYVNHIWKLSRRIIPHASERNTTVFLMVNIEYRTRNPTKCIRVTMPAILG